ncbi:hypothetical protein SERLA73DRAFT_105980 [Serpula lacrymans var. lacrymans S7.3]|uniref:Pterin-binding domain-containing protein n=1 Tax=Serpula lacrymans var. lacrymans (strain S7.3) TaxID=936435 RepID=F8PSH2_SERL3|nr:hypothetical protein SERLA73DRAFT_105980 [Serpula lacrymans var. lacrymans S7.3]
MTAIPSTQNQDKIRINGLILQLSIGGTTPKEGSLQPIHISLAIKHDVSVAATLDSISHSIDYASICNTVSDCLVSQHFTCLETLIDHIFTFIFGAHAEISEMFVSAFQNSVPESLPVSSFGYESNRKKDGTSPRSDCFTMREIQSATIVGIEPHERTAIQPVSFDVDIQRSLRSSRFCDFSGLTRSIHDQVAKTSFYTLEALASFVALGVLKHTGESQDTVTIKAAKPNALSLAKSAEIELVRTQSHYPDIFSIGPEGRSQSLLDYTPSPLALHVAAIALGSNLGDRFANIETALRLLENPARTLDELQQDAEVAIIDTSFMYETTPMYVIDQPLFANCACMVETNLRPELLLKLLKQIETTVGRVPSIRNGPRAVDLDILIYDMDMIDTRPKEQRYHLGDLEGQLLVPHPRMAEREFVLRPLNDMIPNYIHPVYKQSIRSMLDSLMEAHTGDDFPMQKVIPFPRYPLSDPAVPNLLDVPVPPTAKHWAFSVTNSANTSTNSLPRTTYVMATLNATPDSFSDGSIHNALPDALSYATTSAASGADIIDIGGYSTRPGAAYVSPQEEIDRIVPIINGIRSNHDEGSKVKECLISVDTFRWDVAKAAILAGANCINDVYAFTGPDYPLSASSAEHLLEMRQIARDLAVPVILMHSRGDAGSNKDDGDSDASGMQGNATERVLACIREELGEKVNAIVKGRNGVRRWMVIIDPGIGFSKTLEGNLAVLRHASSITADVQGNHLTGYPWLIGASKKSFLGAILEQPNAQGSYGGRKTQPKDRGWATAATVACAVQQGTTIVRVHDVEDMHDVVSVASALWHK